MDLFAMDIQARNQRKKFNYQVVERLRKNAVRNEEKVMKGGNGFYGEKDEEEVFEKYKDCMKGGVA